MDKQLMESRLTALDHIKSDRNKLDFKIISSEFSTEHNTSKSYNY